MSLFISTKLVGALLLIMSVTYFAEGVLLGNQSVSDASHINSVDSLMLGVKTPSNVSKSNFQNYININYIFAQADHKFFHNELTYNEYKEINNYYLNWTGPNVHFTTAWSRLEVFRDDNKERFDGYITGINFYNSFTQDHLQKNWWNWETMVLHTDQKFFQDCYNNWIASGGSNKTYGNALTVNSNFSLIRAILGDSADQAVTSFITGIQSFMNLATFDVKNGAGASAIPTEVRAVLLIFFIPMWTLVIIELAGLATQIVQAVKFW